MRPTSRGFCPSNPAGICPRQPATLFKTNRNTFLLSFCLPWCWILPHSTIVPDSLTHTKELHVRRLFFCPPHEFKSSNCTYCNCECHRHGLSAYTFLLKAPHSITGGHDAAQIQIDPTLPFPLQFTAPFPYSNFES